MKVWNEKKEKNEISGKHYTHRGMKMNNKKAIIVADLVPEASAASHSQIEKEIADSLQCDWLLRVKMVTISNEK